MKTNAAMAKVGYMALARISVKNRFLVTTASWNLVVATGTPNAYGASWRAY